MKKAISVIIPVYNTEKYLEKCLSSVINQTFQDIEIIIVDDGSTDNSYEICKKYANMDKRVVLVKQSNQGQGFARNNALLKANGEYIFFLDSDDYIELDSFELLYNEAISKNSDLVLANRRRVCEKTNISLNYGEKIDLDKLNSEEKVSYIFSEIVYAIWGRLIKKSLIIDNYLFFHNIYYEDVYIAPRIYYYAKNITYVDKEIYNWLDREGSTVNSFSMKHAVGLGGLLVDWTNFLIKESIYEKFEKDLIKRYLYFLNWGEELANKFAKEEEKNQILKYLNSLKNNDTNSIHTRLNTLSNNYKFSININSLYTHITYLKKYRYKIAIYGNGLIGNILAKELKDQLVVIVDRAKDKVSEYSVVCTPQELNNYKFDKLVISVLGREEHIIESLDIEKDKIFEFNFINTTIMDIEKSNKLTNIGVQKNYDVVFIPHKDYHLKTMALISEKLKKQNISSCILDITDYYRAERVRKEALNFPNIELLDLSIFLRDEINYKLIVCMNDWDGMVVKPLIINAKKSNKKTLGIVDGVSDFLDLDTQTYRRRPYQTIEYIFLTGKHDKQFFKDKKNQSFTVGIPRLDKLLNEKPKFPKKPLVVINLNFTYGVLENKREEWLNSVLEACKILNFEYIITQHPADITNLSKYNISKLDMYETIRQGSIVISRFSSIILEALAMGKPVVYHNPHDEKALKFQDSMGAYSCSFDVKSLIKAIKYELSLKVDYRQRANSFLNHHCYTNKNKSSAKLCAKYIKDILDYE